ncbi:MAG: hypothetical protein ACUVS5_08690 [Anaerolineae bacterium]
MSEAFWRRGLAWLFLFLFPLYLLGYNPLFHSSDGLAMFSVAENLVRRGHWDISQLEWMGLQQGTYGPDGLLYCRKGPGTTLAALPLVWLGRVVPGLGMATTALLLNMLVTAGTAALLAAWWKRAKYGTRVALGAATLFGAATLAWPYSKTFFSEPLTGLGLGMAAYFTLVYRQAGRPREAFLAGVGLGVAVCARMVNALCFPLVVLSLWWPMSRAARRQGLRHALGEAMQKGWRGMLALAVPVAAAVGLLLAYNAARFGSPWASGYLPEERFSGDWAQGILGLLVSPGRGLLLYVPILWFALLGWPRLFREHPRDAALWAGVVGVYLLLYGKWFMWHGGYAWGPRFLVPVVPLALLGLAPWMEGGHGRLGWALFGAVVALSLAVAVLGTSVHFALVQEELLREGLPLFSLETFFDPRYSPLLRQWRYLIPTHLDLVWAQAVGWRGVGALLLTLATAGVSLWGLAGAWREGLRPQRAAPLPLGVALACAAALAVAHVGHLRVAEPWEDLLRQVAQWEERTDTILLNRPEETWAFGEAYRGSGWVVGLQEGEEVLSERAGWWLDRVLRPGARVWWVPAWHHPEASAVERVLMDRAFRVLDLSAGERRAALYVVPEEGDLRPQEVGTVVPGAGRVARAAWTPRVRCGQPLLVELVWEAGAFPPTEDFVVYVHLVDAAGARLSGHDGMPALWLRPTSTWRPGEVVVDRHAFPVPSDLEPGIYFLKVGLYRAAAGERIPTAAGEDGVVLGEVEVLPAP